MNELLEHNITAETNCFPTQVGGAFSNQRKLRIVHIVSSMKVGGMEQVALRLAADQQILGHRATAIALQGGPLLQTAAERNIQVQVLGGSRTLPRVLRGIAALARLRPHIIHAHNPTSLHYAMLGKLIGCPCVIMTDHAQTKGIQRIPTRREQRLTDAVVAVSGDTAAKALVRGTVMPMSVIYNGIDIAPTRHDREGIRATLGLQGACIGIMVASMEKIKRHEDLLQAMALLRADGISIVMLIVGDGPERNHLEELARQLELDADCVRFLGIRSDVMQLLAAADFFVLPSEMEGLPIAILEAMAQRCPVIATPVGGVPELITHNHNGVFTPVNDPRSLAHVMTRMAQEPELRKRIGQAAYDHVCTEFACAKMTSRYIDLYYRVQAAIRSGVTLGCDNV